MMTDEELERAKDTARWAVGIAIREGRMTRGPCEVGVDCKGPVQGHHDDYSKPLAVRWLCQRHHLAAHRAPERKRGHCAMCHLPMVDADRFAYCSVECGVTADMLGLRPRMVTQTATPRTATPRPQIGTRGGMRT